MEIFGSGEHGALAVAARGGVKLLINTAHSASIEASGGESVDGSVELNLENITCLLGHGLTQVMVVHVDARTIALVARDHSRLLGNGRLCRHVIGAGAVEVVG